METPVLGRSLSALRARLRAGLVISEGNDQMKKEDKAKVVEELTERLRSSDTLLVADYRGLRRAPRRS